MVCAGGARRPSEVETRKARRANVVGIVRNARVLGGRVTPEFEKKGKTKFVILSVRACVWLVCARGRVSCRSKVCHLKDRHIGLLPESRSYPQPQT